MSVRRIRLGAALVSLVVFGSGCFTVNAWAPPGREVRVLPPDAPAEVKVDYKAWYLFFGLWKVSGRQPADVIEEEGLREVRFVTQEKPEDSLVGLAATLLGVLAIFPLPQSISIEGNR